MWWSYSVHRMRKEEWSDQQESNLHWELRRLQSCPLDDGQEDGGRKELLVKPPRREAGLKDLSRGKPDP